MGVWRMTDCKCGCGGEAEYRWFDGLYLSTPYCETQVSKMLDSHTETRRTQRAGAQPIDDGDFIVKTTEGLQWVDGLKEIRP